MHSPKAVSAALAKQLSCAKTVGSLGVGAREVPV